MKQVNIHEAKTHLSRIVKEVEGGARYVIGKAGNPVAMLIPYTVVREPRKPGAYKNDIHMCENFDEVDAEIAELFYVSEIEPS